MTRPHDGKDIVHATPTPRHDAPCRKSKNERIVDDRATEGETDGALSKSISCEGPREVGGMGFISLTRKREKALRYDYDAILRQPRRKEGFPT